MIDLNYTFDDVIDFWMTFFPEIEHKYELEELLEKSSGSTFHDLEETYFSNSENDLDEMFHVINSKDNIHSLLEEIFIEAENKQRWVYFYKPIIEYYSLDLYKHLNETDIVQDKDVFFKEIILNTINALFTLSYKVLVLETNVARMDGKLKGETSVEKAQYFSTVLLKDNNYIKNLYKEYSELTRLMKLKVKNICNFSKEIIDNTKKEYNQLMVHFSNGNELGKLVTMVMGEGDSHNNGKSVVKLLFSSGLKLIYKPRSLQIESGYYNLIDWINNQTIHNFMPIKAPKVHFINDAGWMEFIEHMECSDSDDIKHFYNRIGQILCLLYLLNGKDFHYENLIAYGDQPVLIDLETLFHAEMVTINSDNANSIMHASQAVYNSVKGIALLPTQIVNKKNSKILDVGGLSNKENQSAPFKSAFIKDFDNAEIQIITDYSFIVSKSNNPILDGKAIDSAHYLKEIKAGFAYTYNWIKENKIQYKSKMEYFFQGCIGRLVYRPTNLYAQILSTSYHPDVLRNTLDRKVYLHRIGLITEMKEHEISVLELNQMLNGDVPYFLAYYDGNSILDGKGQVAMSLPGRSAKSIINQKLNMLSSNDLNRQLSIINYSFSYDIKNSEKCETKLSFHKLEEKDNINYTKLIDTAKIIGDFLLSSSITGDVDGKIDRTWIGPTEIIKDYSEITCVGNDLYSGNSGIALFLASLGAITGDEKYKIAALEAITVVINSINETLDFSTTKIGLFSGISGFLYSIYHIGRILDKKELINFVYEKLWIVKDMIGTEQSYDIVSGVSGTIGVLISIYEYTDNVEIKELLIDTCNELYKIIKQKVIVLKDCKQITWGKEGYVGFSHGNAGVISQIIKLFVITKNDDIINTITSSLCYESSMFDKQKNNWRKQMVDEVFYTKWCHGAPGILLSRLLLYKNDFINRLEKF